MGKTTQMTLPGFISTRERVLEGLPPGERQFVEASIRAMTEVFTAPIMTRRGRDGWNAHLVEEHRPDIIVERLARLMQTFRRLDERLEGLEGEEREQGYREAAKEIRDLKEFPTNWEILLALSDASLEAPLSPEAVEEMKRAFAHCFGADRYVQVWGGDPIDVEMCRLLRYAVGNRHFPPLDEAEEEWIREFNDRLARLVRGEALAEELFAGAEPVDGSG